MPSETRESSSLVLSPREVGGPWSWPRIFGREGNFHVEIGAGRDSFAIEVASARPHLLVLAFELSSERVEKLRRKIERAGLSNVRILKCEALQAISRFLLPESAESFSVLFPDPWPKKRHEHKRVISGPSARLLASRLKTGGKIYLKTDDAKYAARMVSVLEKTPFLRNVHGPGRLAPLEGFLAHETLYERKWRKLNRSIFPLVYVKTEDP